MGKAENLKPDLGSRQKACSYGVKSWDPAGVCFPGSPSQARSLKGAQEVKVTNAAKGNLRPEWPSAPGGRREELEEPPPSRILRHRRNRREVGRLGEQLVYEIGICPKETRLHLSGTHVSLPGPQQSGQTGSLCSLGFETSHWPYACSL